jgi:hypothetical protein
MHRMPTNWGLSTIPRCAGKCQICPFHGEDTGSIPVGDASRSGSPHFPGRGGLYAKMFHVKQARPSGSAGARAKQPHALKNRPMISMTGSAHATPPADASKGFSAASGANCTGSARAEGRPHRSSKPASAPDSGPLRARSLDTLFRSIFSDSLTFVSPRQGASEFDSGPIFPDPIFPGGGASISEMPFGALKQVSE